MTEYSREAFRKRLESLPEQHMPFCSDDECPIAALFCVSNAIATDLDFAVAEAIDRHEMAWKAMTPFDVICIINRLEAEGL